MILTKNIFDNYNTPNLYLCNTNKKRIGQLWNAHDWDASLKWNSYSETSFTIPRMYTDTLSGELVVNPYYDLIETPRMLEVEGFGFWILQDVSINSDGVIEEKEVQAYSSEYELTYKFLDTFMVNTGEVGDIGIDDGDNLHHVVFYDPNNTQYSLSHIIFNKLPTWKIGHVDDSLKKQQRTFDIDRKSIYDFLMNDVAETLKCVIVFDTINNTANFYEEETAGYETDVYITFKNLSQQMEVSYSADDIRTVLKISGADDLNVIPVNMGMENIMDLSYYHTKEWMGEDLYNAYAAYLQNLETYTEQHTAILEKLFLLCDRMSMLKNRVSTVYNKVNVTADDYKIDEIYYKKEGTDIDPIYVKVEFPTEYVANETYYIADGRLTDDKLKNLKNAMITYFHDGTYRSDDSTVTTFYSQQGDYYNSDTNTWWLPEYKTLLDQITSNYSSSSNEQLINNMLSAMWKEYGLFVLDIYLQGYKEVQQAEIDQGMSDSSNANYYQYLANYILLKSVEAAYKECEADVAAVQKDIDAVMQEQQDLARLSSVSNNFTEEQWKQLSVFMREDEYNDDSFVITDYDTDSEILKVQQELLEAGRKELAKLSRPQLNFTMTMANIYTIPEFAPFINPIATGRITVPQFNLGNMIRVELRPDYIKKVRLLEIQFKFDDFSDFDATFGDLADLQTVADIHADLLEQAAEAGKSVANGSAYWEKGADQATATDKKIQAGLISATNSLKSIDNAGQNIEWDTYGLHGRKIVDGVLQPEEIWLTNNQICFSDDNFRTSRAVFGKITIDNETKYGLIADAVYSGLVQGSKIVGGELFSENYDSNTNKGAYFNLNDGVFSFADGALKFNENGLTIGNNITVNEYTNTTVIDGGAITTGIIKSGDYQAPASSSHFATKGTAFNLDTGTIISEDFALDADGNIYMKGNINSNGDINMDGNLTLGGTISMDGDLTLKSNINLGGNIKMNGSIEMGGNITMSNGSISLGGSITLGTAPNQIIIDPNDGISMSGSIRWSSSNSPVKVLYGRSAYSTPTNTYDSYPTSSSSGWHKTISSYDLYASYTYDGGSSWTAAIKIRGEDGEDGTNGSDAAVPDYIQSTYISETTILSPSIYGGEFYATGQGRLWSNNFTSKNPAYYISNGVTGSGSTTKPNPPVGYISYDNQGAGDDQEAAERVFFVTDDGTRTGSKVAMKIQAGGNMSLQADSFIFIHTPLKLNGDGSMYGSKLPSGGTTGQLFFLLQS